MIAVVPPGDSDPVFDVYFIRHEPEKRNKYRETSGQRKW